MGQESKGIRCRGVGEPQIAVPWASWDGSLGWLSQEKLQHPALGSCVPGQTCSVVTTGSEQHPSCSSLHHRSAAMLLPVLPKSLLCIWEAQRKSCILGFAPSGLGAACCGVASAVLRICPRHAGIVMFAVGVGKAVEEELRAIASEPVEQHFSYSADFTTMTHLVENFSLNICPGGCSWPHQGT